MLNHVALTASSEEKSDLFFQELLGLKKQAVKTITADLSLQVFDLEKDLPAINYEGPGMKFEIFITENASAEAGPIGHICLNIDDPAGFTTRADAMGLETRRVVKGEKTLFFIKDFDGHLYEIKGL